MRNLLYPILESFLRFQVYKTSIIRFLITDKRPGRCLAVSPRPASSRLPTKVHLLFSKAYGNDVAAMSHAANIWEFIGLKKLFLKKVIPKGQKTSKLTLRAKEIREMKVEKRLGGGRNEAHPLGIISSRAVARHLISQ